MQARSEIEMSRGWLYCAALFIVALIAFWPSYFSPGLAASSFYIHLHAVTATLWMLMLIAQPWLIRTFRFDLHRRIGTVSYFLVPIVIVSMLLLANNRIRTVAEDAYEIQTFVLYLQISLTVLFAICYAMAMLYRRDAEIHARFMICTGLTLIDPVFIRLFFWIHPGGVEYLQWFTYGLTDGLFLFLIWAERRNLRRVWVFPVMLLVFVLFQIPALFKWTNTPIWQSFARWFQSIPLT